MLLGGFRGSYQIENLTTSTVWSWNSEANPPVCLCRWPGARCGYQAGEVHVHTGRVSAEAQRDQQPPEESPAAEDHFLWECHRQRHPCTPQADVRELLCASIAPCSGLFETVVGGRDGVSLFQGRFRPVGLWGGWVWLKNK